MSMPKGRRRQKEKAFLDDATYLVDEESDTEDFDDTMYSDEDWSPRKSRRQRRRHDAMRRLEDARERRMLHAELSDWDEYSEWDIHTSRSRRHH